MYFTKSSCSKHGCESNKGAELRTIRNHIWRQCYKINLVLQNLNKSYIPWLRGLGFKVYAKPLGFAATSAADLLLKE